MWGASARFDPLIALPPVISCVTVVCVAAGATRAPAQGVRCAPLPPPQTLIPALSSQVSLLTVSSLALPNLKRMALPTHPLLPPPLSPEVARPTLISASIKLLTTPFLPGWDGAPPPPTLPLPRPVFARGATPPRWLPRARVAAPLRGGRAPIAFFNCCFNAPLRAAHSSHTARLPMRFSGSCSLRCSFACALCNSCKPHHGP